KRGHASVQSEQPRSPCVQTSGPSSWSWTGSLSSYPRTWNGQATMQAVHPVQRPVATPSWRRSRHWVVSVLGILGGRIPGPLPVRCCRSDAEGLAAGASVDRLGVVDLEAASEERRVEVQRGTRDDGDALRINHDADVL